MTPEWKKWDNFVEKALTHFNKGFKELDCLSSLTKTNITCFAKLDSLINKAISNMAFC